MRETNFESSEPVSPHDMDPQSPSSPRRDCCCEYAYTPHAMTDPRCRALEAFYERVFTNSTEESSSAVKRLLAEAMALNGGLAAALRIYCAQSGAVRRTQTAFLGCRVSELFLSISNPTARSTGTHTHTRGANDERGRRSVCTRSHVRP